LEAFEKINILKQALIDILELRDKLDYVDEWQEASCYNKTELIALEALKKVSEC
jgi:hypothetical protein